MIEWIFTARIPEWISTASEEPCEVDFDGEDRVMLVTDVGSCHLSRLIRTVVPDR